MRVHPSAAVLAFSAIVAFSTVADADPIPPAVTFTATPSQQVFCTNTANLTVRVNTEIKSGQVVLKDQNGLKISTTEIPAGATELAVALPHSGFYRIETSATSADGKVLTATSTAAVLGPELSPEQRANSPFGLMAVGGPRSLVAAAGAGWDRGFVPQLGISRGPNGGFSWYPGYTGAEPGPAGSKWLSALMAPPSFVIAKENLGKNYYSKIYPPTDWDAYRKVVRFFADSSPWIRYYEGINEPDAGHWQGTDADLVKYHSVLREEIHAAGHGQKLLGPCFWHVDLPHLEKLTKLGFLDSVDGISIHSYAGAPPEGKWIDDIRALRRFLADHGHPNFPVYLTEFGWSTGNADSPSPEQELQQAQYASRGISLLAAEHLDAAIYFCLRYEGGPEATEWSIIHKDGTPRPAYAAIATAYRWLTGCTGGKLVHPTPTSYWLFFGHGNTTRAVAWDTREGSPIRLPQTPTRVADMTGAPIAVQDNQLQLSASPVYMEFADADLANLKSAATPVREIVRGNFLPRQAGGTWIVPPPLVARDKTIDVPTDTTPGDYTALVSTSAGWATESLRVLPPWNFEDLSFHWPAGQAPALKFNIDTRVPGGTLRPCLRRTDAPDEFGSPAAVSAAGMHPATIPLPYFKPGDALAGKLTLESRAKGKLETVSKDIRFLPLPCPRSDNWDATNIANSANWHPYNPPANAAMSPRDCSVKFQSRHTAAALALQVDVTDDTFTPTPADGALWNFDSLQIAFSLDQPAFGGQTAGPQRVIEYSVGMKGNQPAVERSASALTALTTGPEPLAKATITREGNVTRYEITFPWETLGLTPDKVPNTLGFDLAVNDRDATGQRRGLELTPGILVTKNPGDFATLILN